MERRSAERAEETLEARTKQRRRGQRCEEDERHARQRNSDALPDEQHRCRNHRHGRESTHAENPEIPTVPAPSS